MKKIIDDRTSKGSVPWPLLLVVWLALGGGVVLIGGGMPDASQWRLLAEGDALWSGAALTVFTGAVIFIRAIRWTLQIRSQADARPAVLMAGFAWCFILIVLLPFRIGEGLRLLWLKRHGAPMQFSLGVTIMERLTDLLTLLALGCLAALFVPYIPGSLVLIATLGCAAVFLAIQVFVRRQKTFSATRKPIPGTRPIIVWLRRQYLLLADGFATMASARMALAMFSLSVIAWMFLAAGYFFYLRAFDPALPWTAAVAVLLATNLSAIINISPGNAGVYHIAAIAVLRTVGMDSGQALVAATGMHVAFLTGVVIAAMIGKIFLAGQGQKFWQPV